jgi:hypothetical protein
MLTWHWLNHHAPKLRPDLAGRLWYSFYERGAQMSDFCRHALAYITGAEPKSLNKLKTPELAEKLLLHLQARPWLLILDGIERILVAYNRYDAAQLTDEQASHPTDQISNRNPTSAIRPEDDDLLRALATVAPSKIVITSRLVPQAFLNRAGQPIPGVLLLPLPGLRPADAESLFRACGINGDSKAIQDYLKTNCDCHPLVISALAGIINDYLPDRGNFDAWHAHSGQLNFTDLDLVQKRNHILKAAIAAVPAEGRQVLAILSLLSESVDYQTLHALTEQSFKPKELMDAVADLESRGLLLYEAKRYDLHPVVRGVMAESLQPEDRDRFGQQVIDHFSSKPQNPYEEAETLEDVSSGLHLVRTLAKMGRFQNACDKFAGELGSALLFNLEASSEMLSLLKPFFPSGWSTLPTSVSEYDASYLANNAAIALSEMDDLKSSLDVHGVALECSLRAEEWSNLGTSLVNVGTSLAHHNKLAQETAVREMEVELASASENEESIFRSLLEQFDLLARSGQWSQAQAIWNQLDPMGRAWSREAYRPGYAEYCHARLQFWQGKLREEQLAEGERLLKLGKDRTSSELVTLSAANGILSAANGPSPPPAFTKPSPWLAQSAKPTPNPKPNSLSPASTSTNSPIPSTKPTASRTYRTLITSTSPISTSPSANPTARNTTPSPPTNGIGPTANPTSTATTSTNPEPSSKNSTSPSPTSRPTTPPSANPSPGNPPSTPPSPNSAPNPAPPPPNNDFPQYRVGQVV